MRLGFAVIAVGCAALSSPSFAQDDVVDAGPGESGKALLESDFDALLGRNLKEQMGTTDTASRSNESALAAPSSITVLTSRDVRLSGATTLPDVLRLVPGVYVMQTLPGQYVINFRGAGGVTNNNIVFLVDGVPLNNPYDSSVDWDMVPVHPEDVERIEILRGAASTIYGSNAYVGVIAITTKRSMGRQDSYALRLRGGTDLALSPTVGLSGHYAAKLGEWDVGGYLNGSYDGTYGRKPTGARAHGATDVGVLLRAAHALGPGTLSIQLGSTFARKSELDALAWSGRLLSSTNIGASATWDYRSEGSFFESARAWIRTVWRYNAPEAPLSNLSFAGTLGRRGGLGFDFGFRLHATLKAVLSGEAGLESVAAPWLYQSVSGKPRFGGGLLVGLEWEPSEHWRMGLSVRVDRLPLFVRPMVSFRGSGVYHRDDWSLRTSVASAYSAPTWVMTRSEVVDPVTKATLLIGNPTMEPVRNNYVEVGTVFAPASNLVFDVALFMCSVLYVPRFDFDTQAVPTFGQTLVGAALPYSASIPLGLEASATWRASDAFWLQASMTYTGLIAWQFAPNMTLGTRGQQPRVMGTLHAKGSVFNDRVGYGAGASVVSERRYTMALGVPWVPVDVAVGATPVFFGALEFQPTLSAPLWLSARVQSSPLSTLESPFPGAAAPTTRAMLGVELRSH